MQISESMRAVLNAVIILIRRDIKLAQILINKIESSMIPVDLLYLKMRVLFLQELISYLQDDGHSVDVMEKLTCMLRLLGYDTEANGWGQLFKNSIQKDHEQ